MLECSLVDTSPRARPCRATVRITGQLTVQPHAGGAPLPLDRSRRDFEHASNFVKRQSAKITQLHHTGLPRVECCQADEQFVQGEYVEIGRGPWRQLTVERHTKPLP